MTLFNLGALNIKFCSQCQELCSEILLELVFSVSYGYFKNNLQI